MADEARMGGWRTKWFNIPKLSELSALDLGRQRAGSTNIHAAEVGLLGLIAVVLSTNCFALALATMGRFNLLVVLVFAGLATIGALVAGRSLLRSERLSWSPDILAVIPSLIVFAFVMDSPFEFILGAADAGVYINTAANIAQTGSLVIRDPEAAALPEAARLGFAMSPEMRQILARGENHPSFWGEPQIGFYLTDPEAFTIIPHAFHLYPSLLAIAYAAGGLWASLWVTPLLAITALVAIFLVARRLFGAFVAGVAVLFLSANPGAIWFAHYPAAENQVQLLLWTGLLGLVLMIESSSTRMAILAGFILGSVHLTKIEVLSLPLALGCYLSYCAIVGRLTKCHLAFIATYGTVALYALLHAGLVSTWYSYSVVSRTVGFQRVAVGVAAGLLLLALGYCFRRRLARALASYPAHLIRTWVTPLAILLTAGFAYYVRPRLGVSLDTAYELTSAAAYGLVNRQSLVMLGWFVSPMGLVLGVVGFCIAFANGRNVRLIPILALVLIETLIHLSEARISPFYFWAARRWVPVIMPAFALFGAYFLWNLFGSVRWRWPESTFPIIVALLILIPSLGGWLPFLRHVEYRGAVEQIGAIAAAIPSGAIVLCDETGYGEHLVGPLRYLWGHKTYMAWRSADKDGSVSTAVRWWQAQGKDVYLIRTVPDEFGPDASAWGVDSVVVAEMVLDLPQVVTTVHHRPDRIGHFKTDVRIVKLTART